MENIELEKVEEKDSFVVDFTEVSSIVNSIEKKKMPKKKLISLIILGLLFIVLLISAIHDWRELYLDREKKVILFVDKGYSKSGLTYLTNARTLREFLDDEGIEFNEEYDRIDVSLDEYLEDITKAEIKKYLDVSINIDGKELEYNAFDIDIEELLRINNITVVDGKINEEDNKFFNGELEVTNLSISYERVETEIPYGKEWMIEDKELRIGDTKVIQEGITGLDEDIYLVVKDGDNVVSKTLVRKENIREVQDLKIAYGMKITWTIPEGLEYVEKIEDVKAVSYVYNGTPYGAYGLWCSYGTIAVDRSLIPLGSKLYIPGYGYAIANDVGSGINGKKVDLYMERYVQCYKWGSHQTTIYILEYGDNTTNWSRPKRNESLKLYDKDGFLRPNPDSWYYVNQY